MNVIRDGNIITDSVTSNMVTFITLKMLKKSARKTKYITARSIFNKGGADISKYFTAIKCNIKQPNLQKDILLKTQIYKIYRAMTVVASPINSPNVSFSSKSLQHIF